ncbi:hypothetical protein JB92DRAFT_2989946 [Gautieria morchelliformis]|nr:hypothetical protein JB92DRAFT_2989946 [Gautieria morchelliformis]
MSMRREQMMFCGLRYERVMMQDEIVESVVDSATSLLRWSINRPKHGWYLRVQSPSFPPGTFIPLIPPAPKPPPASVTVGTIPTIRTPEHLDGALAFSVRTSRPPPEKASPCEVHINVHTHCTPIHLRHLLHHHSTTLSPAPFSFFSRALACITPSLPIRSTASFTLAPSSAQVGNMAMPLLTFTDHTPTFSRQLGVAPGFWVAVALAYLEFLTERDSYLAAAKG